MIEFSSQISTSLYFSNASDQYIQELFSVLNSQSHNWTPSDISIPRDYAVLEHLTFTFQINAPVYVFRALMQERFLSYYPNPGINRVFSGKFFIPDWEPKTIQNNIIDACRVAYKKYQEMLEISSPEISRLVLPINTYSDMLVTLDLKEVIRFLEFLKSSESKELTTIMHQIINIIKDTIPITFRFFNL